MGKYKIINDNGEGVYEVVMEKSSIKYYVNEPKNTVVAVMGKCDRQFKYEMIRFLDEMLPTDCATCFGCYNLPSIRDTYKGKAHCIGSDKFDLETGMRIARENMLAQYYYDYAKAALSVYDTVNNGLDKMADHIGIIGQRLEKFSTLYDYNFSNAENWKANN